VAAASLLIAAGAAWGLYHLRPGAALRAGGARPAPESGEAAPAGSASRVAAPARALTAGEAEHEVGSGLRALREALHDTHENVRVRAVTELVKTGDPRIVPDLVDALHDQSAAVREAVAVALARLGNRTVVPALKQALKNRDEDPWVRLRLAEAVAGLGDPEGLPALLDLARRADPALARLEALTSLARFSGIPGPHPDDPDGADGRALLRRIESWWASSGRRLRFDPEDGTYRR
jgi:HEAT repeat protein